MLLLLLAFAAATVHPAHLLAMSSLQCLLATANAAAAAGINSHV
jgi:hypothetical protein